MLYQYSFILNEAAIIGMWQRIFHSKAFFRLSYSDLQIKWDEVVGSYMMHGG